MITYQWAKDTYNVMEDKHFLGYPEFCVRKLRLSKDLLNNLTEKENRSRENVINWMVSSGLTEDDFGYAGI